MNDDNEIEIYIGPPRDDYHLIALEGLETCFRCKKGKSVCVIVYGARGHVAKCSDCLSDEEREEYIECRERLAEWLHRRSKNEEPEET